MRGSSCPAADDAFATITESTTAFSAIITNELADAVAATQTVVGPDPSDLTGIGGTNHGTVATLLQVLARMEIGTVSFAGGAETAAGTLTTGRFSTAANIKIFLYPEPVGTTLPSGDDTFAIDATSVTTTGFTARRNIAGGSPLTGARSAKFVALEWPD